ncbi:MAG: TIGR00730 family Rossman fold protein [Patescibacteria group bacterium]
MSNGNLNVPVQKLPHQESAPDFRSSFQWRVFRIMAEFVDGFQFIADFKKSITFFGSARTLPGTRWYEEARKLGALLAKNGFGIVTGGGPGIMEAGNRGAAEADGESIGINIKLPYEQRINPYVRKAGSFHYFFVRKVIMSYSAWAYVYFPGGFGTLDEFFELITLIQTRKISSRIPIVLVGREFWEPFATWIDEVLYKEHGAIDKDDMSIYRIVDTAEEAFEILKDSPERQEF